MITALAWLLACGQPSDREMYLRALEAPPEEAGAICQDIRDGLLRGECITTAAGKAARAGMEPDVAYAPCAALEDKLWSGECYFWVTDSLQLIGPRAVEACKQAGRWRPNCLGHAVGREMRAMEQRHDVVGEEELLYEEILDIIERYKPNAPKEQQGVAAQATLAQIVRARWKHGPFDHTLCGRASEEVCALAYRGTLDVDPARVDAVEVCAEPITLERVAVLGARPWVPQSETLALQAWATWCEEQIRESQGNNPRGAGPPGAGGPNPTSMLEQFFDAPARRDRPPPPGEGRGDR